MKGLRELSIFDCDLAEFPTELPVTLVKLKIVNNKITRITDKIGLPELEELDLSNNLI